LHTTLHAASHSDSGDKRPFNEDRVLTKQYTVLNEAWGMFLVADGSGGANKPASQMIMDRLSAWWEGELATILSFPHGTGAVLASLNETIAEINKKIFQTQPEKRTGSTLSLLLIMDDKYIISHVGDSRIYAINRESGIRQLTEDHSYVAAQVAAGHLTAEGAKWHPKRNVITRSIGMRPTVSMFTQTGVVGQNDSFLLCTDGFHKLITDDEVLNIVLSRELQTPEKVQALRNSIKSAHDNISIILVTQ